MEIALHKPFWNKRELNALHKVILRKSHGMMGEARRDLSILSQNVLQVAYSRPVSSCTAALEVALQSLNIKKNDEVICPAFTFVSTACAIARQGATPVFIDIDRHSFNLNPDLLENKITHRTKAIIVIHYAGRAADIKSILKIAKKHKLYVIEDAAHAFGSKINGQPLGTFGHYGCFSFNETKNLTSDKGGLLVSNDEKLIKKSEIIIDYGTNKMAFLRNEAPKYEWVEIGSNYVLPDILATLAIEQIKKLPAILKRRNLIAKKLYEKISEINSNKIELPFFSNTQETNWHIFPILVPNEKRDFIISYLRKKGIQAAFHYTPLHLSTFAKKHLKYKKGDFPITEYVANSLVRLPIYPQMSPKEMNWISRQLNLALGEI